MSVSMQMLAILVLMNSLHGDTLQDDDTSDQDLCDAGWIRNGNACYQLVESTVDYTTALDACRNLNDYGDLASVADQDESNFLFVLSSRTFGTNYYWIGFNDLNEEGTWAWTDGSVSSYTNWYSGEPSGGSEHCGVLRWSSDGTWYDADCSSTYGYICKYPLNTISCAEWKRKGYTSDGYYTIDPDGRNNGVDPYRVYCDMTTDASTGITTFEHQEANRSLVTDAEAPFSFIRNIIYGNKSVNQVATGADISGECYQYIKVG
ncbi:C-type lectin lectoxin-Enh5-like [Strongylocentrotus purpuratus]|uniref:C-type lectin n=1 Tax=Strongylocentrotus purpuratus TaxID=7668 RepID=A0A7M7P024_STRPU|nr:C-type lectin lectoxin-Enh5-like [Strongylocentrotus purpuratus]